MTDFGNPIITITMALLAIAIAITVHEFCHGLVSNLLGDSTAEQSGRLSLNPLAHIDPLTTAALPIILILMKLPPFGAAKPVPINVNKLKYQEFVMAMVSVAGPLSNLLLALFGGLVLRIFGTLNSSLWVNWWVLFVSINIAFFIFNLIPFPPLDGSRVLFAFAPEVVQKFMLQIEAFGIFAIFLFMFMVFPLISPTLQQVNGSIISWLLGL